MANMDNFNKQTTASSSRLRRHRVGVLAASIILALQGCATSMEEDQQAIADKLAANSAFTPQTWATQVDPGEVEQARDVDWLASFNDSQLTEIVNQALANNRNLMAAAANVEQANALAVQAGAAMKPQVDLALGSSGSGSLNTSSNNSSNNTAGVQLGWELDLWGRIGAGQQAAVATAEAAAADYKYAQHSLAAATSQAYFLAVETGQQVTILKEVIAALDETLRIVNVQLENGLATAQDLALTRSDQATTREQLVALEGAQREALRALEVLLGEYPDGDMMLRALLPELPKMPPVGVPSEVLERRPDIIAAERQVASAFNAVKEAKAARLPRLSLTANVGGSSSELSQLTDPANLIWQAAGNFLMPIFDGGSLEAAVDAANAEQKAALANYGQTALEAFSEVENNLDLANTLSLRQEQLKLAYTEAKKAYDLSQLSYKEGEIALLDLLTIQQRVLNAQSSFSTIQRLALDQRVNLYLALGGDW